MELFRGYIRTKGKKAIDKFKGEGVELRTLAQVDWLEEYAGILAEDTVLIDVDDTKQAEKLFALVESKEMLCQVRRTTRGMHFFFKNDGSFKRCATGVTLALGVKADVKIGSKNSYSCLKVGGIEREVIYDVLEGETYQAAPFWLRPLRTKMELAGSVEGEGRNTKLFSYILPLQEAHYTKEQIIETLGLINQYIFDEPLSDDEFNTITRDEAFSKAVIPNFYTDKGSFLHHDFGEYLMKKFKIIRINGMLHHFDGRVYVGGEELIESKMIEVIPHITARHRTEALKYIKLAQLEEKTLASSKFIAFENGIYNLESGELEPFSDDVTITNLIPWNYRAGAVCEVADKTLNKLACGKPEIRALIEEMAGYCFYRRNELRKAFILTGDKANGKSTFISMIQTMLGDENCCSADLKDLSDKFKTIEIFGKLANLGDDINDEFIKDVSIFKKLVTGDPIMAEKKGKDPVNFRSYAKLIFSANALPRMKDKSGAVLDRLIIVPFNARFSRQDADFDPFIKDKLTSRDSIEYLISVGMEGLKRVLNNHAFTVCQEVAEEIEEYNKANNPILDFLEGVKAKEVIGRSVADYYAEYHEFCVASNLQTMSRAEFSRYTKKHFDVEIVRRRTATGERDRFFEKKA